jgi:hypothetical protein
MPLPSGIMQPNNGNNSDGGTGTPHNRSRLPQQQQQRSIISTSTTARRSNKACWFRFCLWIGAGLAAYQVVWSYWLAGLNIPDVEIDKVTGQKRIRRRPHKLLKHDPVTNQQVPTYVCV